MFTQQCRKGNRQSDEKTFNYIVNEVVTNNNNNPRLQNNLSSPFIQNRGIPNNLIDINTQLRGQDRNIQPNCNEPQFSTLDHNLASQFVPPRSVNITDNKNNSCDEQEMPEFWRTMNMKKPLQPYNGAGASVYRCKS